MKIDSDPDFQSPAFLEQHVQGILAFYDLRVFATNGGFHGCFRDNGESFSPDSRPLVGSSRYVFNYATAFRLYGQPKHLEWAEWGLTFLVNHHRQDNGGYAWALEGGKVVDDRVMAYGHAFVLLAAASCVRIGVPSALSILRETFDFMESYFWDADAEAYADERDATLSLLSPYRGQNANMHMCEALLAAWQATADPKFLDRAETLAHRFAIDLASQTGGQIWEHYDMEWKVDMKFNIDSPLDRYKPWGFQPGHQAEWSKLLMILDGERPDPKWLPKAQELFEHTMRSGWDNTHGGILYGVAPDGRVCGDQKHFWVQAESFAAAWRLFKATNEARYLQDYERIWRWSWDYMVDHEYGAWFRTKNRDGSVIDDKKSPLGKTDYHTLGACWDVLSTIKNPNASLLDTHI